MGTLTYDGVNIDIDDRTLLHLQIVIVKKLRRGESFLMSWRDAHEVGDGRSAIWLHPSIPLHFKFHGSRIPTVNEDWLARLLDSADGSRGLVVVSEEGSLDTVGDARDGTPARTVVTGSIV